MASSAKLRKYDPVSINVAILPDDDRCRKQKYWRISQVGGDRKVSVEHADSEGSAPDYRRSSRRDYDKIIYTSAWRRLAGVTQVVSPDGEDEPLHNRLTHSEKVSQTAWSIGANIINDSDLETRKIIARHGGLDLDMVSAAALAHDLGHSPFGHVGESALDLWGGEHGLADGFEGNAQSFRIVTRLARWRSDKGGLKMRLGTLAAITKYPWIRGADFPEFTGPDNPEKRENFLSSLAERRESTRNDINAYRFWGKYGAYRTDEELLIKARSWMPEAFTAQDGVLRYTQSLEATIMDCADDIAYALHDLEDFLDANPDSPQRVRQDLIEWQSYLHDPEYKHGGRFAILRDNLKKRNPERFSPEAYEKAVKWFQHMIFTPDSLNFYSASPETAAADLTSWALDEFLGADKFKVLEEPAWERGPLIEMDKAVWHRVTLLKAFTMEYVIKTPAIAAHQMAAKRLVRDLAEQLYEWANDDISSLPVRLKNTLVACREHEGREPTEQEIARNVIDYLCSLSDHAVASLTSLLQGPSNGVLVGRLLR